MSNTSARIGVPPSEDERRRRIEAARAEAGRGHLVLIRGAYAELPVVTLPQSLLLYRVDNGRIVAELQEAAARLGRSVDALRAGEESAEVQQLLHGLLYEKASRTEGPILAELRRMRTQTEPLLVSATGVVVNGNRRLSAMRELLGAEPDRFAAFETVTAAVMPADSKAVDFELVEAALQMAPETKLAYGWLNRRMKLRRQRDELRVPAADIIEAYRLADEAQLAREVAELDLAETYLRGVGAPLAFDSISDAEPLFVGLAARLADLSEPLRPVWRQIGFTMIGERKNAGRLLVDTFPFAPPLAKDQPRIMLARLAAELELDTGNSTALPAADALGRALAAREPRWVTMTVLDLADDFRNEHERAQAPGRIVNHVRKARRLFEGLDAARLTEAQRRSIRAEVAAIQIHLGAVEGIAPAPVPPRPAGEVIAGVGRYIGKRVTRQLDRLRGTVR